MSTYTKKPDWIKTRAPLGELYKKLKNNLNGLHTVCEEAKCPNKFECWERGTATFMILGGTCSRGCRFCSVNHGNPNGELDLNEPEKLAESISSMNIKYAVITSVDRDDLEDLGSVQYAKAINAVKEKNPYVRVEALIPDFQGNFEALERVILSGVDVLAHNVETTEKLTPQIRDRRASYKVSLDVLKNAKVIFKKHNLQKYTKTSLILGFGENYEDIYKTMLDMREADVDILAIGQYLQPAKYCVDVSKYYEPKEFDVLKEKALEMGFKYVVSGPMVRTSYMAEKVWEE